MYIKKKKQLTHKVVNFKFQEDQQRLGVLWWWLAPQKRGEPRGPGPGLRAGWSRWLCELSGHGQPGLPAQQPHLVGDEQVQPRVWAEGALLTLQGGAGAGQEHQGVRRHALGQVWVQLADPQGRGGDAQPAPQPLWHQAQEGACRHVSVTTGVLVAAGDGPLQPPFTRSCAGWVGVVLPLPGRRENASQSVRRSREEALRVVFFRMPCTVAAPRCGVWGKQTEHCPLLGPGSPHQAAVATLASRLQWLGLPLLPPSLIWNFGFHCPEVVLAYFEYFFGSPL